MNSIYYYELPSRKIILHDVIINTAGGNSSTVVPVTVVQFQHCVQSHTLLVPETSEQPIREDASKLPLHGVIDTCNTTRCRFPPVSFPVLNIWKGELAW